MSEIASHHKARRGRLSAARRSSSKRTFLSKINSERAMRLLAGFLCFTFLLPAQVRTSMDSSIGEYSAPWVGSSAYWRKTFGHNETNVVIEPPTRLKEFVVDGSLTLSLKNYLDLVIANNTDIGIQKLTLEIPKNAIQRAFGVFDPLVTSSFSATRAQQATTNQLQGAAVLSTLNQPFQARVSQLTPFSTTLFGQMSMSKLSTNDQFALFNPSYNTSMQLGFQQPLLRGRGRYITRLPITIARAQRQGQEFGFYDTIQRQLVTAENVYWDVVSARERLKVQQKALELAEEALKRAKRELELGATSPLEIYQPEQQAATARINVTQVEYQLRQFEDVLRRQIGADIDLDVRELPVVLTEDVSKAPDETKYDHQALVKVALDKRPDLKQTRNGTVVSDLQIRSAIEQLKPQLNLQAQYSTTGRGGTQYIRTNGQPTIIIPGGIGDTFGQWFDFNTYSFSLNLTLPLRDRAASANLADAVVSKRLNALRERSIEQQVRQEVLNAITQVESSREGVRLAQIALDFAQKRVEADQKRYDLGVINIFFLLSAQTDFTNAQANLVTQTIQHKRNLLQMQQRLGTLLEDRGIMLQP